MERSGASVPRTIGRALTGSLGIALLVLLGAAAPAAAAISLVASGVATTSATPAGTLQIDCPSECSASSTGDGNTIVVVAALRNPAALLNPSVPVTDSGGSVYTLRANQVNGNNTTRVLIYSTTAGGSKSSTWIKFSLNASTSDMIVMFGSYSGVVSLGTVLSGQTGTTNSSFSVTTSDSNNWVVAGFAGQGGSTPSAVAGNLRRALVTTYGTAANNVGGALTDNTSASAGSVTNTVSIAGPEWTAVAAVELRTVPAAYLFDSQSAAAAASATTCPAMTLLSAVPGNTRVVVVAVAANTTVSAVSDTASNFGGAAKVVRNGSTTTRVEIWSATVASGASKTVNVTLSGSAKSACAVADYAGVAALGVNSVASATTANPTTAALTTQDNNNLVVAGYAMAGTTPLATPAAGTDLRQTLASSGSGANVVIALADERVATPGSVTAVVTRTAAQYAAAALELRAVESTWNFLTSAASMAPPALDPWTNLVFSGSNDFKLYGMSDVDGVRAFTPFATGGMIQSRPAVIPAGYRTPASAINIAYVGSTDGFAYAINSSTGAQVWKSPSLGTTVQGGAGVWLQTSPPTAICGVTSTDVVFFGSSNTGSATTNKVYALNGGGSSVTSTGGGNCVANGTVVAPGGILWTFGASNPMDIISSTPYPDYVNNALWVTSRSNTNAQASVWKLNIQNGALIASWNKDQSNANLGDIDSSPTASNDGTAIYVGTNAGKLNAIRSDSTVNNSNIVTHTPASGAGAVKGTPWWLSFSSLGVATPDTIIFTRNTTVHSVNYTGAFTGSPFTANWTVTPTGAPTLSAPIDDGGGRLYVGGSDGKVHQLLISNGTDQKQVTVSAATPTVGDPTFNLDRNTIHVGASDGRVYTFTAPLP